MRRGLPPLLLALGALTATPARPDETPVPSSTPTLEGTRIAVAAAVAAGRVGEGVARCSDLPRAMLDRSLRELCAQAAMALGDRLAEAGQMALARSRWEQALDLDPSLADRPDFMRRFSLPLWPVSEDDAPPDDAPDGASSGAEAGGSATGDDADAPGDEAAPERAPVTQPRPAWQVARGDLALGLGLGWYDGLVGLTFGVLSHGNLEVLTSIGLAYASMDLRLRYLPLEDALTPTFGFGFFVPFDATPRIPGTNVERLDALYELGDAFHLDLGLSWFLAEGASLSATASFVTTIDQEHPDAVVFHPQISAGAALHF